MLQGVFLLALENANNIMKGFLSALFKKLEERKVIYCVLRNYERLPEWVNNDVDIWVGSRDWVKFYETIKELADTLNYTLNYTPRLTVKGEGDYFLIKEKNNRISIIHLDCWAFLHWKGICFVDESIFDKHLAWNKKGFYIPSPGIESAVNLLKDLLYHGKLKYKYKEEIKKYSRMDAKIFLKSIRKPFGNKTANFILEMAKEGSWETLEKRSNMLRLILILKSLSKPLSQSRKWFNYFRAQFSRYFIKPHGLFIVLIGPDGSGKTTIAKMLLKSDTAKKLFQKKMYFHGHFPFLPELKRIASFFKRKKHLANPVENASNFTKPFGVFRSMIYPIYYGLNYFLGHIFIWKERARAGLILFDRYFYDYLIQKQFINCPRWLLYTIGKIIPKPDAIIYLKNNPETIHNRKQELTIEEIERQSKICQNIANSFQNSIVIETSGSPEKVVEKIQKIVINRMKEKQKIEKL